MQITIEQVRQFMERAIPFNAFLGLEIVQLRRGFARIELPFRGELVGDPFRPALHGGVLSALIDTTGGAALWTEVGADDRLSTVDMRVDYLRPAPLKRLYCEARVLRVGNRVGVTDMLVFATDEPEHPLATGKGVYSVKRGAGQVTIAGPREIDVTSRVPSTEHDEDD